MAGDFNVTGLFALFTVIKQRLFLNKNRVGCFIVKVLGDFYKFLEKHLVMFRRKHYLNNLSM
tara:strand:+ start:218 stop:403 length:186 start_codon:yes stop_codon:yes gene_type:complete